MRGGNLLNAGSPDRTRTDLRLKIACAMCSSMKQDRLSVSLAPARPLGRRYGANVRLPQLHAGGRLPLGVNRCNRS